MSFPARMVSFVGAIVAVLAAVGAGTSAPAAIVYQQNFEPPVTTISGSVPLGGFVQLNNVGNSNWQVQGGGGGSGVALTAGVDTNGVGGSQALFGTWDHTQAQAGGFTFNQYTVYGVGAPNVPLAQIQVAMDLFISGSEGANNPLAISLQQGSGPTFGERKFTPTLANGAFTHVVFTLDQATVGGIDFDPAQAFNLQVNHGAFGFGFDAGNTVRIDNVLVQTVPEPASAGLTLLAACGMCGLLGSRRRKT